MSRLILPADIRSRAQGGGAGVGAIWAGAPAVLVSARSKVSAELRFADAIIVSAAYSSVSDVKASNPATQATAARRPSVATSTNGLPMCTFVGATPTQLIWPDASNNNSTQKWGFSCWIKVNSYANLKYLLSFGGSTGRYDNCKAEINFDSSRRCILALFGQDTSNYTGRQLTTATNSCPTAGTLFCLRAQFDGTQATELLRHKVFINEVDVSSAGAYSNVGTGGTPVLLRADAENIPITLGNYQNDADTSFSLSATVGPTIRVFNDSPTAAEGAALMSFERPT